MEGVNGRGAPTGLRATGNLGDRYIDAIAAAVRHSQRPATRRAYEGAWERFRAWAEAEGVRSLPAEPLTVAAYLAHRAAAGLSVASLAMDRKSISHYHRAAGRAVGADGGRAMEVREDAGALQPRRDRREGGGGAVLWAGVRRGRRCGGPPPPRGGTSCRSSRSRFRISGGCGRNQHPGHSWA